MKRQEIVSTIQRIARENGHAPGRQAFERATAVKESDWYPHIWLRWSEALAEAGFAPNQLQARTSDDVLIDNYIEFTRELGHVPVQGELRRKAKQDQSFPSHSMWNRFGGKEKLLQTVAERCKKKGGLEDVLALCEQRQAAIAKSASTGHEEKITTGFVYLMKSGKHYKIGRTGSLGRRGSELAIKIPVPPKTIHSVETDDPVGVEAYWHRRFADKRGEGEWFFLDLDDVAAFKRWKRIV